MKSIDRKGVMVTPGYPPFTRDRLASYMRLACNLATYSTDTSSQTGAIILDHSATFLASGINSLSPGMPESTENHARPRKYRVREHAERNAVYAAARSGHSTEGAVMIAPWIGCTDCDRAIIASGISSIVRFPVHFGTDHWSEDIALGDEMLLAAGVEIIEDTFAEYSFPKFLRNGQLIDPRD